MSTIKYLFTTFIFIGLVICSGCTSTNQDEEYKALVTEALTQFDPINEHIIKPYAGMSGDEMSGMKEFATQARDSVNQMTLSDNSKKSKEFFVRAMDASIEAVSTLEPKFDATLQKVESTAPATNLFIQIKNDLGSAADIIKVPNKKGY